MGDHDSDEMSSGASVEETLELWASSLRGIKERIRPCSRRSVWQHLPPFP